MGNNWPALAVKIIHALPFRQVEGLFVVFTGNNVD